jgi:hypothetical protein|nr:MAG: hypothetical protein [Bacteriophage sp.]UVX41585.1 MAG: hypothetical protein [Bacteriophage sp.]UVX72083.1 MAG: hypothetical protein [Bacteriophage sp.]UVY39263.1 MAG: hypothetical protein [Bacteriophage sp.]DAO17283.1 MAG TPA: hypothetical protein [Bacteriophage sp.]
MNINNELEKFRQRKAQEFFTQELPNRLKGFKAALEGTPEEIKKKLDDQEEIYVLDFWDKLDKLTEQEKKTLELAGKTADVLCEGEEKPLASEIIADQQEEIENLKKKLKATERDRELFFEQKSVTVMQNDIINFVLNVNDYEYLETLQNHVRTVYNQQIKKQEA